LSKLLGRRSFGKAAGILSGGEVLFSVLLPRCKEVVAVDHSYGSIAIAYLKVIMLDTMGAKAMKELLFEGTTAQITAALNTAAASLPPEMVPHCKIDGNFNYEIPSLRREWFYMPTAVLERAKRKLDKVTVVHGDIMDATNGEQVGLLYTSNATEHNNKDKKMPKLVDFAKLVRKGGLLLCTSNDSPMEKPTYQQLPTKTDEWELVKTIRGLRTSWWHNLYRRQ
jgi:hypothetical protein